MSNKKLILVVALYVAIPALLAWVGYKFGMSQVETSQHAALMKHTGDMVYYEMPTIKYAEVPPAKHTLHLKMTISIELPQADMERVSDFEPRIAEKVMLCLRGECFDDTTRGDHLRQLRADLVTRINQASMPFKVVDVAVRDLVFD